MLIRVLYKVIKTLSYKVSDYISWLITYIKFKVNGVIFHNDFTAYGIPIVSVNLKGFFIIGKGFSFNSGLLHNMIGRQQPCFFIVGKNAKLCIGDNVGMSCTAIVCQKEIIIEDEVRIGGGVVIYDTDFHSLNLKDRTSRPEIFNTVKTKPVIIRKGAFIGAHATILKGVEIGEGAIVGAVSVVTKSIPSNETWAGNPAKFIRKNEL